ncbi:MAG: molybdopterin-guanine dinucleotide biosynthesis protein B [Nitrospira sp.]|nr:molybdopterin-guanine dinucleotide biosynthesis protein B [Nitrospira sp.]
MKHSPIPIPVLCFVGTSNSGKTTLITKVISLLTQRGYNIATVKHTHKEFKMDSEGKDSWRHRDAGAKTVVLASPTQFAVMSEATGELTIEDVLERFINSNTDILIVEGFKKDKYPKIEVHRKGISGDFRYLNDPSIIALASDDAPDIKIPVFDINNAEGIADFIEQRLLKNMGGLDND